MSELPIAPSKRIMLNAGAERVSADAAEYFNTIIEAYGMEVAKQATKLAHHAGRKTVRTDDIKLAMK